MKQYTTGFITAVCLTASVFMFVGAQNKNLNVDFINAKGIILTDNETGSRTLLGGGVISLVNKDDVKVQTMAVQDYGRGSRTFYFNGEGKQVVTLGNSTEGDGMISVHNANGEMRDYLGISSDSGHLLTLNRNGEGSVLLGGNEDGVGFLNISNADGEVRTHLGNGYIQFFNKHGNQVAKLGSSADETGLLTVKGSILTQNADGENIVILKSGPSPSGGGSIQIFNDSKQRTGLFGVDEKGNGWAALIDHDGKIGWTANIK